MSLRPAFAEMWLTITAFIRATKTAMKCYQITDGLNRFIYAGVVDAFSTRELMKLQGETKIQSCSIDIGPEEGLFSTSHNCVFTTRFSESVKEAALFVRFINSLRKTFWRS